MAKRLAIDTPGRPMDGVAENRLRAGLAGLVAIAPDETARILFTQIARSPL